jgi:hypothetical protein
MSGTANGGNGRNGRNGIVATVAKVVAALPPGFIVLVLLNIATIGASLWIVEHNLDARNAMIQRIIESCLKRAS